MAVVPRRGRSGCSRCGSAAATERAAQLAALEVERRVAVEQGPHAVQREPRLRQRARLGRTQPAAVSQRRAAADAVALDHRHVELQAPQVVRAAQSRDPAAHDDDVTAAHLPSDHPVTCSSIRMPARRSPRRRWCGRAGAAKYSLQIRFHAAKSAGRRGSTRPGGPARPDPPASSTASIAAITARAWTSKPPSMTAASLDRPVARPDRNTRSPSTTASEMTGSPPPIVEPCPTVKCCGFTSPTTRCPSRR